MQPGTNSTVSNYENIESRIKAFKELMNSNLKEGGDLNIDSAIFYWEAALNYDYSIADSFFTCLTPRRFSLTCDLTRDNKVSVEVLGDVYDQMVDSLSSFYNGTAGSNKHVMLSDVSSSGSSNQTLFLDLTSVLGTGNYQQPYGRFDSTDYWFWAWDQGKCGPYYDPTIHLDAIDQLLYKIHHPISHPAQGWRYYFVDIETVTHQGGAIYPILYPDENYSGEWEPYRLFSASGEGEEPPEQPCINPDDMNYYLYDGLVYIINDLKPGDVV